MSSRVQQPGHVQRRTFHNSLPYLLASFLPSFPGCSLSLELEAGGLVGTVVDGPPIAPHSQPFIVRSLNYNGSLY